MKTEIRTDLLRKLANHLLNGKLGHEKFDFNYYNIGKKNGVVDSPENRCGTNGCAIGECPVIWPKKWTWNDFSDPCVRGIPSTTDSIETFFCLTYHQQQHLFIPNNQSPDIYGGLHLDGDATKEQVANNIIQFCELAEANKL